jgi:hypothetical protein
MRSLEVYRTVAARLRELEVELRRRQHINRARVVADLAARYEATSRRLQSVEDAQTDEAPQPVVTSAR